MKMFLATLILSATGMALGACTDVSHTETTKRNWDGSTTHQETTVQEHPGGAVTVDRETSRTR